MRRRHACELRPSFKDKHGNGNAVKLRISRLTVDGINCNSMVPHKQFVGARCRDGTIESLEPAIGNLENGSNVGFSRHPDYLEYFVC